MNKPNWKYVVIAIIGIGAIGVMGVQTYYTRQLVQGVADRSDVDVSLAQPSPTLGQWDPWIDMQRLQARIDRAFDRSFDAVQFASPRNAARITLEQHPDNYVVKAAIPGAGKRDIKTSLDGQLLSISSQTRGSDKETAHNGAVTGETTYRGEFEEVPLEAFDQMVVDLGLEHEQAVLEELRSAHDVQEAVSVEHTAELKYRFFVCKFS